MYGLGGFRRYVRRIEKSIPNAPSRRGRRRTGGKRWNIHLRRTPVRRRLKSEGPETLVLLLSLAVTILLLLALLFR